MAFENIKKLLSNPNRSLSLRLKDLRLILKDLINFQTNQTGDYKKYVALLTQTGVNAPTATILENTIGDIVWTRNGAGDYIGTLAGAFPLTKTTMIIGTNFNVPYVVGSLANLYNYTQPDIIGIATVDNIFASIDNLLANTYIEIRVYN